MVWWWYVGALVEPVVVVVVWMQGCWMQNRTVQSLAGSELACPPSVTPVVMQLQSEEGRNISLKCKVTGQSTFSSLFNTNCDKNSAKNYCLSKRIFGDVIHKLKLDLNQIKM